jgi:hypothetical protein
MLVLNQIPAEFPFLDALIGDLEHTWWRLFKKRAMCTKFDKYSNNTVNKRWKKSNGQFRYTGKIGHKTQNEEKQNKEHNTRNLKEEQHGS